MGFTAIKTFVKDRQVVLLFVVILFLSIELSSGSPIKNADLIKKNDCRYRIFAPHCRGQQKRDLLNHPNDENRLPLLDEFPGIERSHELATILNSPTLLGELLRIVIESSPEYDPETGNYLKK